MSGGVNAGGWRIQRGAPILPGLYAASSAKNNVVRELLPCLCRSKEGQSVMRVFSGLAMAKWLSRQGADVRVADSRRVPPGRDAFRTFFYDAPCVSCKKFRDKIVHNRQKS